MGKLRCSIYATGCESHSVQYVQNVAVSVEPNAVFCSIAKSHKACLHGDCPHRWVSLAFLDQQLSCVFPWWLPTSLALYSSRDPTALKGWLLPTCLCGFWFSCLCLSHKTLYGDVARQSPLHPDHRLVSSCCTRQVDLNCLEPSFHCFVLTVIFRTA